MKNKIATLALSGVLALGIVGCVQQPAEKKSEAQQSTQQQSTQKQTSQQQNTQQQDNDQQSSSSGFSKEDCTANALASVGAGDSATNVTTSDRITGGGTDYYLVEFDLGETHFRVQVDALDGSVIDVTESVDGEALNYDDDGNVIDTTSVD